MMLYVARAPSPPLIQFLPVRVYRGTTGVLATQDGQPFVLLPSLHAPDRAPQITRDLFPAIQSLARA